MIRWAFDVTKWEPAEDVSLFVNFTLAQNTISSCRNGSGIQQMSVSFATRRTRQNTTFPFPYRRKTSGGRAAVSSCVFIRISA